MEIREDKTVASLKKHLVDFFGGLNFNEEQHKYSYNNKGLTSVSGTISKFVKPFDTERVAEGTAKKRTRLEGVIVTKEEVLAEWEELKNVACTLGTKTHLFGETFQEEGLTPETAWEEAIVKFWDDLPEHIVPVMFELQMFNEEWGIAGTADIILFNLKTEKFILADYKTNKDLFKNHRGQKLLIPFDNKLDCPFSKYEMQLTYYKLLFEKSGFEVERSTVIWLLPDGNYKLYDTEDLSETILTTL